MTTPVDLVIPDGVFAGQEMSVEWGGVTYSIAVPEGVGPGQEITVELSTLLSLLLLTTTSYSLLLLTITNAPVHDALRSLLEDPPSRRGHLALVFTPPLSTTSSRLP